MGVGIHSDVPLAAPSGTAVLAISQRTCCGQDSRKGATARAMTAAIPVTTKTVVIDQAVQLAQRWSNPRLDVLGFDVSD
jgi:hypothetical protein